MLVLIGQFCLQSTSALEAVIIFHYNYLEWCCLLWLLINTKVMKWRSFVWACENICLHTHAFDQFQWKSLWLLNKQYKHVISLYLCVFSTHKYLQFTFFLFKIQILVWISILVNFVLSFWLSCSCFYQYLSPSVQYLRSWSNSSSFLKWSDVQGHYVLWYVLSSYPFVFCM